MKQTYSTATAGELEAWRQRHDLTTDKAALALGLTRRTFAYYLAGKPIPETVARLMRAIDALDRSGVDWQRLLGKTRSGQATRG